MSEWTRLVNATVKKFEREIAARQQRHLQLLQRSQTMSIFNRGSKPRSHAKRAKDKLHRMIREAAGMLLSKPRVEIKAGHTYGIEVIGKRWFEDANHKPCAREKARWVRDTRKIVVGSLWLESQPRFRKVLDEIAMLETLEALP